LSSDDITSIFTSCYAMIRIRKRDCTSITTNDNEIIVISTFWKTKIEKSKSSVHILIFQYLITQRQ
jgi:hypothetical protein